MAGWFDRINASGPAIRAKRLVRARSPETFERLKLGISGARRAMREPPPPRIAEERLFWDPPPRRIGMRPLVAGEVSSALYARLDDRDLATMYERLSDEDRGHWQATDDEGRKLLALHFCVHYRVPGVLEKTGLSDAEPPPDVTALARGSLDAGGSFGHADVVADSFGEAGVAVAELRRALDFGCSSGRVTRVLAAAYPRTEWHGCDVDEPAVRWAGENLDGASFFTSNAEPPLPFPDAHLDAVFAISIWTHFSAAAALRWFDEMHRVIAPGGHLMLTAHGNRALEMHAGEWGGWPRQLVAELATALWTDGYAFTAGYGRELSHTWATPDWGEAFFTPEWLAHELCPRWAILQYEVGRLEAHHDAYVLERR